MSSPEYVTPPRLNLPLALPIPLLISMTLGHRPALPPNQLTPHHLHRVDGLAATRKRPRLRKVCPLDMLLSVSLVSQQTSKKIQ
jgi:hypothetical protein